MKQGRSSSQDSQSERDWAYAKLALSLAESEEIVIAAIAVQRYDKPNPQYYTHLTVRKAAQSLAAEARSNENPISQPGSFSRHENQSHSCRAARRTDRRSTA